LLINFLAHTLGWRHALQLLGTVILLVLFPVAVWVTRSAPDGFGVDSDPEVAEKNVLTPHMSSVGVAQATRSASFWLILGGSTLVIGAIGAVIQHFILFLKDSGYSETTAARFSSILLASSLAGRVIVGYIADRFRKTYIMAFFYLVIGASVLLLIIPGSSVVVWTFSVLFGFSMGADYMLIPLVTAECFGTGALGKLLALIIMGYSVGQWAAPWLVGRIFDAWHSYDPAWKIIAIAGILGSAAIYAVPSSTGRGSVLNNPPL
jgi:MFS family permease